MNFEFCWQHRNCNRECPVRESESVFCWRIAHRENICHPDNCRRCSYRRNWMEDRYDLREFISRNDKARGRRNWQRILAVDDEPNLLFALEETIVDLGCNCLTAVDGEEGLFFARKTLPDLVITDVQMPGMTGYELCRALKADPKTAPIPVIMVTVLTSKKECEEGYAAGAASYLFKPFHVRDLETQIRALLPRPGRSDP
jgi:CheY-like chemotaxis protein